MFSPPSLINTWLQSDLPAQQLHEVIFICHDILQYDCEEHGIIAQKVLFDIHKANKQSLEDQSGPFFDWLTKARCLSKHVEDQS